MTSDNDKANAAILLSADEAVEKKILAVLLKNPQLIQNALDTLERDRMAYQSQQYTQGLAQSMMQTKQTLASQQMNNVFGTSNSPGLLSNTYKNPYGGK